jgi:membrane-bound metal-dependent hydrolase YbcI (DUF457 family)
MFLGHFAVALGAKKVAPRLSLGALVFAAQFADLLWPVFLLLGWEQVRIVPGITRVVPLDFVAYPWSHSLAMQFAWGAAIGAACFAITKSPRSAVVLVACVPSHWLLDYITHRPDMPIVPGGPRYGLALWNSLPATLVAELGLFALGVAIYVSVTRAKDRAGRYGLWSLLVCLLVLWFASLLGPPPPNISVLASSALAIWLTVPWSAWADRHRMAKRPSGG